MARKMPEKRPEEDNRYHDTWKLLKKCRDVTWSLEVSVRQVKNQFRIDYDCSIEDFLDSIYMAGADLGGTIIEDHAKCIERSYKMLTLLENATRTYLVETVTKISSSDWSYLSSTTDNRITLFTCVAGDSSQRWCVQAVQAS